MKFSRIDLLCLTGLMLAFWYGALRDVTLPGLYMDAVNPDYMAAQTLHPALQNPNWRLPAFGFPILGNLYHGVQTYYAGLLVFRLLGISVTSVYVEHALFGAVIVAGIYLLASRVTGDRLMAFFAACMLATDIAFVASFRTQFFIILAGEAWVFLSLLALWRGGRAGVLVAGVCYGLAIYGYFVLGFLAPAMLVLVLAAKPRRPLFWLAGMAIGLTPYAAGYVSAMVALGGAPQLWHWLRATLSGLAPLSSRLTLGQSLAYALNCASLAISGTGDELMMFGQPVIGAWGAWKGPVFICAVLLALTRWRGGSWMLLALLPVCYVAVATLLGNRLWVHHFSVLVPLCYLAVAIAAGNLPGGRAAKSIAICASVLFILANLAQGDKVYQQLVLTGGAGKSSDALTRLAADAVRQNGTLYVFPEWGFFMSFELLTKNAVPYILDTSQITALPWHKVAIAYWSPAQAPIYQALLTADGAGGMQFQTYRQRDGQPAFYLLRAVMPSFRYQSVATPPGANFNISLPVACGAAMPREAQISWNIPAQNTRHVLVKVGVNPASAILFTTGGATGMQTTGPWMTPDLTFFLIDADTGRLLGTAKIARNICRK